jgi:S-phase kinase-associated protein 1
MTTATLEDFMAMPEPTEVDPEPEDHGNEILGPHGREALAGAEAQMVQHDPTMSLEGVVVVETSDGEVMDVEKRIAFLSPILQLGCVRPVAARRRHLLLAVSRRADSTASLNCATGAVHSFDPEFAETPVHLHKVSADAMERVIEYCSFHLAPGHSVKERKNFNKQFMRMDTARLCELASASHYLDLKSLIDLTCRALAKHIQGKNPEEIRETFNLPDDLTEEEKVAPIEFGMEDSRVRMLNSLYARKRKELAEAKRLENSPEQLEDQTRDDKRDVDDLLSFIEGGGGKKGGGGNQKAEGGGQSSEAGGAKSSGTSERKRKKKERERAKKKERAEQQAKLEAERLAAEKAQLEADRAAAARRKAMQKQNAVDKQQQQQQQSSHGKGGGAKGGAKKKAGASKGGTSSAAKSEHGKAAAQSAAPSVTDSRLSVELDSDDISDEDEFDPDLRAAQDREVEEFARRLNGSLDDLAGQPGNGSADMFAAFVTNMQQPASDGSSAVPDVEPAPAAAPISAAPAAKRVVAPRADSPESDDEEDSSQSLSLKAMVERLNAEAKRIEKLVAEATRLEKSARQRSVDSAKLDHDAAAAAAVTAATAGAGAAAVPAVSPIPPPAPPPHDFRQKLAGSIERSSEDADSTGGGNNGNASSSVHRWSPPRRVATAVWAPPPLFEAADPIPGITKGSCAVSYCVATLTVPGVKTTDVCLASFTGLGRAHAQLSAHVSEDDEVTVILRGIEEAPGADGGGGGRAKGGGETIDLDGSLSPQQREGGGGGRIQPTAGQLTVVAIDYLAKEVVVEEGASTAATGDGGGDDAADAGGEGEKGTVGAATRSELQSAPEPESEPEPEPESEPDS